MFQFLKSLVPSLVRTASPIVLGWLVVLAGKVGLDWTPSPEVEAYVSGAIGFVLYLIVRVLEEKLSPKFGWLLGMPVTPTYESPAKPSEVSPTGFEATETSPVPEGEPVDIVPVTEDPDGFGLMRH